MPKPESSVWSLSRSLWLAEVVSEEHAFAETTCLLQWIREGRVARAERVDAPDRAVCEFDGGRRGKAWIIIDIVFLGASHFSSTAAAVGGRGGDDSALRVGPETGQIGRGRPQLGDDVTGIGAHALCNIFCIDARQRSITLLNRVCERLRHHVEAASFARTQFGE